MAPRSGRISVFSLLLILTIVGSVVAVQRFGPYYWDYCQMKEITNTTARTWKILGRQLADDKLAWMIEDRGLSDYLDSSFCDMIDKSSGVRVQCSWEVDVYYPFSEQIKTLEFRTEHFESMDD
jgi:hypothetical protein